MTQEQYGEGYRRGFDLTVRLLVSRGIDAAAAEESAQAAWTRGWECRDQLRDPNRLLTWVNTIALNLFRSEHRRPKAGPLPPEIPVTPRVGPWTIDLALVIEKCNPAEREMLQKHYLAGYTSRELAAQVGCTDGALRVRMLRLRRRLQAIMRRKRVGGKGVITARSAFEHGPSPSVQGI